jgi:hypothetical protein
MGRLDEDLRAPRLGRERPGGTPAGA